MDAYVYVDGLNLYYRALKGTQYKWLDLVALCDLLCEGCNIPKIRYFTSPVNNLPWDPTARQRQDVYIRALQTCPSIEIHWGRFQVREKTMLQAGSTSNWVKVVSPEEKGSDVNLATYLVLDAARGRFDRAYVV